MLRLAVALSRVAFFAQTVAARGRLVSFLRLPARISHACARLSDL